MKLIAQSYISPLLNQGTFTNVTIEDVCLTHKRKEKYISIAFEMSYLKNDQKVVLDTVAMGFLGMENDEVSSNRTTTFSIPNPDYDAQIEGSQERITVPLFAYLMAHNGVMPADYVMVDYGYPTYEKVMQYFEGGTLENPEITISAPLAKGFLLSNLIMNGEAVGNQFTIV
ncbi:hypothetical protein [Flavobacterium algoritolerans]|uniref:Uncharacterized protein n=1 Tax=Flavobacterium algoritolerans TaxID=3041254 RepID=A0ABT6VB81_9FLAO|nr:hypothetical protein [Flavobacterium algoritolerans]MDI5894409.1 hypothetical protein [Flavobacterium algoritolerans]